MEAQSDYIDESRHTWMVSAFLCGYITDDFEEAAGCADFSQEMPCKCEMVHNLPDFTGDWWISGVGLWRHVKVRIRLVKEGLSTLWLMKDQARTGAVHVITACSSRSIFNVKTEMESRKSTFILTLCICMKIESLLHSIAILSWFARIWLAVIYPATKV